MSASGCAAADSAEASLAQVPDHLVPSIWQGTQKGSRGLSGGWWWASPGPPLAMRAWHLQSISTPSTRNVALLLPSRQALHEDLLAGAAARALSAQTGTAFFRGSFSVPLTAHGLDGHPADTYFSAPGWSKGLAWVNGFNLGWYDFRSGPQLTLYIPGPALRPGANELVLLELVQAPANQTGPEQWHGRLCCCALAGMALCRMG